MTIAAPVAGECAAHRGVKADWACQRCGSFVCTQCERRTRPEAPPLCPNCWSLREQTVKNQEVADTRRLQKAGLALGVLSFLHPLIMVASLVVSIRELVKGRGGSLRWMNVVGLGLTGLAILTWVGGFAYLISRH
jgi:hypothetical protein